MKAIFETDRPQEIKRLAKVDNMASFIWELKHNECIYATHLSCRICVCYD